MNSDQDRSDTDRAPNEQKGSDKAASDKTTNVERRQNTDKAEKRGEKDGAVLGKINDE